MADGKGCRCSARSESECGCDADWTPQELIDARAEIARLRGDAEVAKLRLAAAQAEPCPYVTGKTTRYCTLTPFTLTDEEREAVEWAIYEGPLRSQAEGAEERADTLRNLLERLK